jgi:hypothetical protein
VSSSNLRGILARGRMPLVRFIAERLRDHQSDCRDDREQPYASGGGKTSGAEHKQGARVTDFRLVQERIAFDNDKCDSRGPEA